MHMETWELFLEISSVTAAGVGMRHWYLEKAASQVAFSKIEFAYSFGIVNLCVVVQLP